MSKKNKLKNYKMKIGEWKKNIKNNSKILKMLLSNKKLKF